MNEALKKIIKDEIDKGKARFEFGAFEGGLLYISDNFDETPEGFEEYV